MPRDELEAQYELVGGSPKQWLEKSHGFMHCANILMEKLVGMMDVPPHSRRVETLGLVDSILLLLGLAFENLIKGVYIAKHPSLVNRDGLDRSMWKADSGHGITEYADSLVKLEPDEKNLLIRLQEYVVWAGRYPIPTKSGRYGDSKDSGKHRLSTSDFETSNRLFNKLVSQLP